MTRLFVSAVVSALGLLACDGGEADTGGASGGGDFIAMRCDGFFDRGDYSAMCFHDGTNLHWSSEDLGPLGSGGECAFEVGERPASSPSDEGQISVLLFHYEEGPLDPFQLADGVFDGLRDDPDGEVRTASGLGDEAFYEEETSVLSEDLTVVDKTLYVRERNVILSFHVTHTQDEEVPCAFADSELEQFARVTLNTL